MADTVLGYTRHPASAVWPDLSDDEFRALRESIREDGQEHAILATQDRLVIDGWHRLRACAELGLEPKVSASDLAEAGIARKVIGAHSGRRHLTKIEIARHTVATMEACGMKFAEPGDRRNSGERSQGDSSPYQIGETITRKQVSTHANVSEATAMRAIRETKQARGISPEAPPRSSMVDDWRIGLRKVLSKNRNTLLAASLSEEQSADIAEGFKKLAAYLKENRAGAKPGPKPKAITQPSKAPSQAPKAPSSPPDAARSPAAGPPPASDMPDIPAALDRRGRPSDYPPKHTPVGEAWHDYATAYREKNGAWPAMEPGPVVPHLGRHPRARPDIRQARPDRGIGEIRWVN